MQLPAGDVRTLVRNYANRQPVICTFANFSSTACGKHLNRLRFSVQAISVVTMSEKEALLKSIEKFILANRMPETTFGIRAMSDPSFIAKLRKGRSVRIDTAEKLRGFMRDYKQDGKPRPNKIAAQPAA